MGEQKAHLTLIIDTKEPIELADFVGAFTSLGNELERFVKERSPTNKSDVNFFVREVRSGSVVADILAGLIGVMDQTLILEHFVKMWGERISILIKGDIEKAPETKGELKDFYNATKAIARDPNAVHRLEAAVFEDGKRQVRAAFQFNNSEAQTVQQSIEDKLVALEKTTHADHERVLMVFTRSDIHNVDVGKRSGERVAIEEISEKPLALMYGSEQAENAIKSEIRDADDNVYKKGFVVDVNVRMSAGKPVAYSITEFHQVIDMPDD